VLSPLLSLKYFFHLFFKEWLRCQVGCLFFMCKWCCFQEGFCSLPSLADTCHSWDIALLINLFCRPLHLLSTECNKLPQI
jgi:hypothetical protein